MRKLFKFIVIGFVMVLILGFIAVITMQPDAPQPAEPTVEQPSVDAEAEPEQEEPAAEPEKEEAAGMDALPTKAEYDAIKEGMTREQVEQLLGKVVVESESESEFDGIVSVSISYRADGDIGANIFVTYTNGKMDFKSSYGLGSSQ